METIRRNEEGHPYFLTLFVLFFSLWPARAFCSDDGFIVIAHRGACAYLPEHTLEAKALAHGMDPDYIEQDVALTKDDVPVVIHDHFLDTVTDVARVYPKRGRNDGRYYVIDFTLSEIRRLRVHERTDLKTGKAVFPKRYPLSDSVVFRIPTLEEEIDLIQGLNKSRKKNIGLYVELKAPWFHRREGKDIAKVVLDLLYRKGYCKKNDRIFLQCFDPVCLKRLRYLLRTEIRLVQLIADDSWNETPGVNYSSMLTGSGLRAVARYADGIGPWINQLMKVSPSGAVQVSDIANLAHAAGLFVHPYTARADALPDNVHSIEQLFEYLYHRVGVDGAFSDFPDLAVSFKKSLLSADAAHLPAQAR